MLWFGPLPTPEQEGHRLGWADEESSPEKISPSTSPAPTKKNTEMSVIEPPFDCGPSLRV